MNQQVLARRFGLIVLPCLLALTIGCSDSGLGRVTGTIHMDGEPLEDAVVTFYPIIEGEGQSGGASAARTDAEGKYELSYGRDKMGAEVGEHRVFIVTGEEGAGGDYGPAKKETVPKRYNVETELRATVKSGRNVIDFLDLTSEGEIMRPRGY